MYYLLHIFEILLALFGQFFRILSFTRGYIFHWSKICLVIIICNYHFISSSSLYMSNTVKLLVLCTANTRKQRKQQKRRRQQKERSSENKFNCICQTLSCRSSIFSCIVNLYVTRQVQPYTLFSRDCRFSCDNIRSFW